MPAPLLVIAPRMPATRVPCQELLAHRAAGEQCGLGVRGRYPVARVGGIRIAAVTVVGGQEVALRVGADHVVAGQQAVGGGVAQVRMVEAHAGIELGDHDAVAAGGQVPGVHRIDRRRLRRSAGTTGRRTADHRAPPARSGAGRARRTPPAGPRAGAPASAPRRLGSPAAARAAAACRRRCGAWSSTRSPARAPRRRMRSGMAPLARHVAA